MGYPTLELKVLQTEDTPGEYTALNRNCIVDGRFDIAYEEIAEAKANLIKAAFLNEISEEVLNKSLEVLNQDRDSIGRISPEELALLIDKYSKLNKTSI